MSDEEEFSINSKIVVIGDGGVGKTSLISRFTKGTFYDTYMQTIGAQFSVYDYLIDKDPNKKFRLLFWDIAGQKEFQFMWKTFYSGAEGAILVFDVTKFETIEALEDWYEQMIKICGEIPTILFGNKIDLVDSLDDKMEIHAKNLVDKYGFMDFFTTSAKTGVHVEDAFHKIIEFLLEKKRKNGL